MVAVPKSFADDFDTACRWWDRIGQGEDIPEIREAARQAFAGDQFITEWAAWIKSLADFQRELEGLARRPMAGEAGG